MCHIKAGLLDPHVTSGNYIRAVYCQLTIEEAHETSAHHGHGKVDAEPKGQTAHGHEDCAEEDGRLSAFAVSNDAPQIAGRKRTAVVTVYYNHCSIPV